LTGTGKYDTMKSSLKFRVKIFSKKSKKYLTKNIIDAIIIIVKGVPLKKSGTKK
jgi:hypothetical protein